LFGSWNFEFSWSLSSSSDNKIFPISALDMGAYNPMNMNMNMSLGHLAAMNPFFLSQNGAFLNQLLGQSGMNAAMHQGWAGGLSGKTVSQLWMNDETKVCCLLSAHVCCMYWQLSRMCGHIHILSLYIFRHWIGALDQQMF
jgi:hypothetical protein